MKNGVKDPVCVCGVLKSEHEQKKPADCPYFQRSAHQPGAPRRVSHHAHGESRTYPHLMFRR
jgi:hypothetical protein